MIKKNQPILSLPPLKYFVKNKSNDQLHLTNKALIDEIIDYFNQHPVYGTKQIQYYYWKRFSDQRSVLRRCKTEAQVYRLKRFIRKLRQLR